MTQPQRDGMLSLPWPMPASAETGAGRVRVVLLGADGCHLCEVARVQVGQACEQHGVAWRAVNLADAPPEAAAAIQERYGERIPVVFIDDAEHAFWRVDPAELEAALRRQPRRGLRVRIRDFVHSFTKS